jgi:exonuclease-1
MSRQTETPGLIFTPQFHLALSFSGIGKSCKFWGKVTNPDLSSVLLKIPSYLNMSALEVTDTYVRGFLQANETFLYQLVFDPKTRELRPLNDYPEGVDKSMNVRKN